MLKQIRTLAVKTINPKVSGRKHFHPIFISWSYLYLGKPALANIKNITPIIILMLSQKLPGKELNGNTSKGGSQPPKNSKVANVLINNMLAYSPRKKSANVIAEYSTL
jgi:hypothetical protein